MKAIFFMWDQKTIDLDAEKQKKMAILILCTIFLISSHCSPNVIFGTKLSDSIEMGWKGCTIELKLFHIFPCSTHWSYIGIAQQFKTINYYKTQLSQELQLLMYTHIKVQ